MLLSSAAAFVSALRRLGQAVVWLLPASLVPSPANTHGTSRWAGLRGLKPLGAGNAKKPRKDGIVLGWLGSRLLQTPAEDNALLFGVQRSGKTSAVVVPSLLTWRGAVVATSTKEELVRLTARYRCALGPVHVFAPVDDNTAWLEEHGITPSSWNPVAEVQTVAAAAELADTLTAEGKRGPSAHWYISAANLLTALMVFEHERGGDMRTVLSHLNRTALDEYRQMSAAVSDRTAGELLLAVAQTPDREAGSIVSTARSSVALWVDERIARATSWDRTALDLDRLLDQGETLYLVAPAEDAERLRPLFTALLQTLLRRATARARMQGGVLSPRLLLALDEAANFTRIPRLAGYASSGPGQGIQLLLCLHDLAQLEAAYGPEETRTVWNNCRARLLLPGQGDLRTLEHFSRAIGDETRIFKNRSSDGHRSSTSEQRIARPLASVDELRRMTDGVLIYASSPPARLRLRRWDQVPEWRGLVRPKTS